MMKRNIKMFSGDTTSVVKDGFCTRALFVCLFDCSFEVGFSLLID